MDQIYGIRWSQAFGNDPLGKYKNSQGQQNPRMEQWIDAVRVVQWPALKQGVYRCRMAPKPYDGWLPDLQSFIQFLGRAPRTTVEPQPSGTWVDNTCGLYLLAILFKHGPLSQASVDRLREVNEKTRERFNALILSGDLPKEWTQDAGDVVHHSLVIQHKKLTIEPASPEERQEILKRRMG